MGDLPIGGQVGEQLNNRMHLSIVGCDEEFVLSHLAARGCRFFGERYILVDVSATLRPYRQRLLAAANLLLGVVALWLFFVKTPLGQILDTFAMAYVQILDRFDGPSMAIIGAVISTPTLATITAAVCLVAVVRRRWQLAARVVVIFGGANITTQLLKSYVLGRVNYLAEWATPPSLPSGHTTAAATIAVAIIIVVPSRYRPWASAFGALWVSFVGLVIIANGWHRPSDLVAALLVTGAWATVFAPSERGRVWGGALRRYFWRAGIALSAIGVSGALVGAVIVWRAGMLTYRTTKIFDLPLSDYPGLGAVLAIAGICSIIGSVLLVMRSVDAKRQGQAVPPKTVRPVATAPTAR
ncbi:MAG: phosphatase PAP2 family protein [Bowdeniella nasicola]|nr:phosphatase PAP2 family protein [Bowdeniella nasicola]